MYSTRRGKTFQVKHRTGEAVAGLIPHSGMWAHTVNQRKANENGLLPLTLTASISKKTLD